MLFVQSILNYGAIVNNQIVIPMTGNGSRFINQGYEDLKPLIKIHNKPMIKWVTEMFDIHNDEFLFICREDHLSSIPDLRNTLESLVKESQVISLSNWKKKGPAYDVLQALKFIDDQRPIYISYCDYYMHWDYSGFHKKVLSKKYDGGIPCYFGFHPHLIHKENLYASCQVDKNNNLIEIKEKFAWSDDRFKNLNSPGLYYFKNKTLFSTATQKMIDACDSIKGEYYISLVFNYLNDESNKVYCPENVTFFCQWGTPSDLNEYETWINYLSFNRGLQ